MPAREVNRKIDDFNAFVCERVLEGHKMPALRCGHPRVRMEFLINHPI